MPNTQHDSFSQLRDTFRWRVAVVLAALQVVLMVALGTLNTRLGLPDTALLAWIVLAISAGCLAALFVLPKRLGGTLFFVAILLLLIFVPWFGLQHGRTMAHWAFIAPPLLVFLLRSHWALLGMIAYGAYVSLILMQLAPLIETVRFAAGYGLLVCFLYTYALLEERAAALLRYYSAHDALSNCFNRRTFNEALERLDGKPPRQSMVVLLVDIDHFKAINDHHGHMVGDRIITQVAAALGRVLERHALLYRYGGEEFAVLIEDADEAAGEIIAERLRQAVHAEEYQGITVSISVGVAEWRPSHGSITAAIAAADKALYTAKRSGRNRVAAASMPD